jgi:transcription elongation factor GreA
MAVEKIPFTKTGFDRLQLELDDLRANGRPQVIAAIAEARAHGDLSENAEYHAARERQGMIEARINDLEDKLSRAQVIAFENAPRDRVGFGAHVTIENDETGVAKEFQIVGDLEADIDAGRISAKSPIAKALMGKSLDDLVQIRAPKGTAEYIVTGINYP